MQGTWFQRKVSAVARLMATFAALASILAFVPAASAQTCAYNSTQGTCACPTSGAGTTCFGGQLFRSSDTSCQNDARPCATNQNWDCATESCTCNTASFPCGGCTAASSTVGAACTSPSGGAYTNVCGACACPSGKTLCASSNTCVTTLSCPSGTTFDPCTNTCGTPYVLLSPGATQSGFIQVNGNISTTSGNVFGGGDFYIPNGKAIRVDGSGVTNLNIGNWGAGGTGLTVTLPATSQLCFGASCRATWPSSTDFDPTYVNASGDTITGTLNLTGASTNLYVAGKLGVGTTAPVNKTDIAGNAVVGSGFAGVTAAPANGLLVQGATAIGPAGLSYTNHLLDVTVAGPQTTPFVTFRDNAAGNELDFSRNSIVQQGGDFVMDTGAGDMYLQTVGTPKLFIQRTSYGGNVGIGTTSPAAKLDVSGTVKATGLLLPTGAGAGKVLVSDASGNGTWTTNTSVTGSGTIGTLPKFTGASTIGDSIVQDGGTGISVNGTSALGGYAINANNNGQGGGINVQSNSSLNGVPALNVRNAGAGPGLIVVGGSSGFGTQIQGGGDNIAFEAADYNHSGTNTAATVMQVRRGTGTGIAPAAGMGGMIAFPLQQDSSGSYGAGPAFGGVIESTSPWKTGISFVPDTYYGMNEKMRLTDAGFLGIGTSAPGAMLTVNGGSAAIGTSVTASGSYSLAVGQSTTASGSTSVAMGYNANATGTSSTAIGYYNTANNSYATAIGVSNTASGQYSIALGDGASAGGYAGASMGFMTNAAGQDSVAIGTRADATNTGSIAIGAYNAATGNSSISIGNGIDVTRKMTVSGTAAIGLGSGSDVPTLVVTTAPNTAGTYGKVGVCTQTPGVPLDIQCPSSDGNAAIKLAGSYIGDNWDGILHLQSGGGVVSFDGGDSVGIGTTGPAQKLQVVGGGAYNLGVVCGNSQCFHFNNNGWIYAGDTGGSVYGGVGVAAQNIWAQSNVYIGGNGRSSWPGFYEYTSTQNVYAPSSGWYYPGCPSGYITGWMGYNCQSGGCVSTYGYDTYMGVWIQAGYTAYLALKCGYGT